MAAGEEKYKDLNERIEAFIAKSFHVHSFFFQFSYLYLQSANQLQLFQLLFRVLLKMPENNLKGVLSLFYEQQPNLTSTCNYLYSQTLDLYLVKMNFRKNGFLKLFSQLTFQLKRDLRHFLPQIEELLQRLFSFQDTHLHESLIKFFEKFLGKFPTQEKNETLQDELEIVFVLLKICLKNPFFKSFFVYSKKTNLIVDNWEVVSSRGEGGMEELQARFYQCLLYCVDSDHGIRSLFQTEEDSKKLVEDMPIERHLI